MYITTNEIAGAYLVSFIAYNVSHDISDLTGKYIHPNPYSHFVLRSYNV